MTNPRLIEEISNKLGEFIAASPARDIEKNARAVVTGMLSRLDVVTRDEYDVLVARIERLQARIDALEARLADKGE